MEPWRATPTGHLSLCSRSAARMILLLHIPGEGPRRRSREGQRSSLICAIPEPCTSCCSLGKAGCSLRRVAGVLTCRRARVKNRCRQHRDRRCGGLFVRRACHKHHLDRAQTGQEPDRYRRGKEGCQRLGPAGALTRTPVRTLSCERQRKAGLPVWGVS